MYRRVYEAQIVLHIVSQFSIRSRSSLKLGIPNEQAETSDEAFLGEGIIIALDQWSGQLSLPRHPCLTQPSSPGVGDEMPVQRYDYTLSTLMDCDWTQLKLVKLFSLKIIYRPLANCGSITLANNGSITLAQAKRLDQWFPTTAPHCSGDYQCSPRIHQVLSEKTKFKVQILIIPL